MVRAISKNRMITDGTDFYRILGKPYLKPNGTIYKTDLQKLETEEIITMPYNFLVDLLKTGRRHLLPPNRGLTVSALRLIPLHQLEVTLESKELMSAYTEQLNKLPENTPKLYETDGRKDAKYPAHYFYHRTDYYVKEYDGEDEFFVSVKSNRSAFYIPGE
jgi:hypothetical protein